MTQSALLRSVTCQGSWDRYGRVYSDRATFPGTRLPPAGAKQPLPERHETALRHLLSSRTRTLLSLRPSGTLRGSVIVFCSILFFLTHAVWSLDERVAGRLTVSRLGIPIFDPIVSIGNFISALAIAATAAGILVNLRKDRALRRKEYADKIRRSAAMIMAKVDRWQQLSLQLFSEIQPFLARTDMLLLEEREPRKADDFFWCQCVDVHIAIARRIMDEQIEIAYSELFGYDPRFHSLFTTAVQSLREIDRRLVNAFLLEAQRDILAEPEDRVFVSTRLGNKLRARSESFATNTQRSMGCVLDEFQSEVLKLIQASDAEIVNRAVDIASPSVVFKASALLIAGLPTLVRISAPPDSASVPGALSELGSRASGEPPGQKSSSKSCGSRRDGDVMPSAPPATDPPPRGGGFHG
jgi:hypothetical protein